MSARPRKKYIQFGSRNDEVGCVGEAEEEVHTNLRKVVIVLKVFWENIPDFGNYYISLQPK